MSGGGRYARRHAGVARRHKKRRTGISAYERNHREIKLKCPKCGTLLDPNWLSCPKCEGQPRSSKSAYEKVHHPQHYGGDTTYECIKVIEAWGLDKDFCLGTVLRYISRMGKKPGEPPIDDLKKASWYLNRRIEQVERKGKSR